MHSIDSVEQPIPEIRIAIMVAMARNRCIGVDNSLPWHLPDDFKRFKQVTLGKPIIMGRKTYESIGRPLPGRVTVVVTRNTTWQPQGLENSSSIITTSTLDEALQYGRLLAVERKVNELVVVGGGQIYAEALPHVNKMYITTVDTEVDGDAFFPEFDRKAWRLTKNETCGSDERHAFSFAFQEWDRLD